jgi:signal transduction histidine kinase
VKLRISLNSIIGFSELMMVKAPRDLNEKQERYVQNVHASGKHLLELIQKIS